VDIDKAGSSTSIQAYLASTWRPSAPCPRCCLPVPTVAGSPAANRDSCDLGLVDPSLLLASLFSPAQTRYRKWPSGDTRGAAHPSLGVLSTLLQGDSLLLPSAAPGLCQTDKAPPALVTFPSCDLVALLDMPSGNPKIRSIFVQPGSSQQATEPHCPVGLHAFPLLSDAGAETA